MVLATTSPCKHPRTDVYEFHKCGAAPLLAPTKLGLFTNWIARLPGFGLHCLGSSLSSSVTSMRGGTLEEKFRLRACPTEDHLPVAGQAVSGIAVSVSEVGGLQSVIVVCLNASRWKALRRGRT